MTTAFKFEVTDTTKRNVRVALRCWCSVTVTLLYGWNSDTAFARLVNEYCESVTELSASDLLQRSSLLDCRSDHCNTMAQPLKNNNAEFVEKSCICCGSRKFISTFTVARLIHGTPLHSNCFKNDFKTTLPSTTRSFTGFIYFRISKQFLCTLLICSVCYMPCCIIIIIIIIIIPQMLHWLKRVTFTL